MMNIINGGAHSDAPIAFQEFMIRPVGASSEAEAVRIGAEVFHALQKVLKGRGLSTAVGDEGGFAPKLKGIDDALDCIIEAIKKAGFEPGKDVKIAMDCAASEFCFKGEDGKFYYDYKQLKDGKKKDPRGRKLSTDQQINYLKQLINKYPIDSIEDGLSEEDWEGWVKLTKAIGDRCQLVGDDLFVTNVKYLQKGIEMGAGNSILIKVNQIGSLTETLDAIEMAHRHGYTTVTSHRSGDPVRPRTPPSPTSPSLPTAARSRPVPCPVPTVSPSTTASCASRSNSATRPATATPSSANPGVLSTLSRPAPSGVGLFFVDVYVHGNMDGEKIGIER